MLLLAATLLTIAPDIAPGLDRMPIVAGGNATPMPTSPGKPTVAMPNAAPGRYREEAHANSERADVLRAELLRTREEISALRVRNEARAKESRRRLEAIQRRLHKTAR